MAETTETMSKSMKAYFETLDADIKAAYKAAESARKMGLDIHPKPEIPLVRDMAERVEGLVGVAAPQIIGSGISKRIKALEKIYSSLDWRISLIIAEEITQEKFCKFKDKKEAMEIGIRVGFAYHTMGTVSSPLEGLVELKFKKRRDGKEYVAIFFSGPIRSAGGTGASVSVLITDYIRKKMGYAPWDPTPEEIKRYVSELYDYHDRVTNLQYLPSEEEIEFIAKNLPVQIDGGPSEKIEVSQGKDLDRVETNCIRNGVCLVIGEGLAQKAPKIWRQLSKWGSDFDLDQWNFMEEFVKLQKSIKAKGDIKNQEENTGKISPDYTFIKDLVAGRPIFTHPLRPGGFRLRYGRARTSGYSSNCVHPATMLVTNKYLAIGSQLKTERPGKGATVTSCTTIEGPIVLLDNGNVVMLDSEQKAKQHINEIKKILFLGDMLISYGDFYNRAHTLVPPGYCYEWWIQELEKAAKEKLNTLDPEKISQYTSLPTPTIQDVLKNPNCNLTGVQAVVLSDKFNIPMFPLYTPHFNLIPPPKLNVFLKSLYTSNTIKENDEIEKIVIKSSPEIKELFEQQGIPHLFANKEFIVIEKDFAAVFDSCFDLSQSFESIHEKISDAPPLTTINTLSSIVFRDRSGTFIGARMGRPEKAKQRKLTGSPHVLFPVGKEGGRLRSFQSALDAGKITAEFPIYKSPTGEELIYPFCHKTGQRTTKMHVALSGALTEKEIEGETKSYREQSIDIQKYFDQAVSLSSLKMPPDLVKGVRGTSNRNHTPEHLVKGILRAKHDVFVNKDGTIRYDMTQLPLTHFKPIEIGVSISKLKELGYSKDIYGAPLSASSQVLELKPQDIVLPRSETATDEGADKVLRRVANFVDELLVSAYKQKPFYSFKTSDDLIGHMVICLAPHTSAAIIGRIIGFSNSQGFFAHPLLHAATRRDCIAPQTYVPIYKEGTWQMTQIGKFVESFSLRKIDNYTLGQKINNCSTLGYNIKTGKLELVKVDEVTKHSPRPTLTIMTENGREIEATPDHKFYVKEHSKVVEKRATDLKENDLLVAPHNIQLPSKEIKSLFIPDFYHESDLMISGVHSRMKRKISSRRQKFCNKYSVSLTELKNYLHRKSWPSELVKAVLGRIPASSFISIKRDNVSVPSTITLTKDVLWLVGVYVAEGFSRKNISKKGYYQVSFAATEHFIRSRIVNVVKRRFNLSPSTITKHAVIYSSKFFYLFFTEFFCCGSSAYEKRIPTPLLSLPLTRIRYVLQGYFDGDGSTDTSELRVTCDTVSSQLIEDLYFVLSRYGVYFRRYTSTRKPGKPLQQFYLRKGREVPSFTSTKLTIPSDYCSTFARKIGFSLPRKQKVLVKNLKRKIKGTKVAHDAFFTYLRVKSIKKNPPKTTYCLNANKTHNFIANNFVVHNCDGDEACVILLLDALLNFSKEYLPAHRGATQDAPLVITTHLFPAEVDDMVFHLDIPFRYPLELYEAALNYKLPWDVKVPQIQDFLNTPRQYEGMGFTHDTASLNLGVLCSAYKTLPSMAEKLEGQMDLADRIVAVDEDDVARLVIEKHFLKDTKGNLRKFSTQEFRCVNCNEKYRRPPLKGKCKSCGGKILFTVSEGSVIKYMQSTLDLAKRYKLSPYLNQTLEVMKEMIEGVFGKEKEKQTGLKGWMA